MLFRSAGSRSKVAVLSNNPNVDPIGSCIGPHQSRINTIIQEVGGEKIDLLKFSEDKSEFIASALSPAKVISVKLDENTPNTCKVIVPGNQLSLAIGNHGQNVRLAARLTGYKIDIHPSANKR